MEKTFFSLITILTFISTNALSARICSGDLTRTESDLECYYSNTLVYLPGYAQCRSDRQSEIQSENEVQRKSRNLIKDNQKKLPGIESQRNLLRTYAIPQTENDVSNEKKVIALYQMGLTIIKRAIAKSENDLKNLRQLKPIYLEILSKLYEEMINYLSLGQAELFQEIDRLEQEMATTVDLAAKTKIIIRLDHLNSLVVINREALREYPLGNVKDAITSFINEIAVNKEKHDALLEAVSPAFLALIELIVSTKEISLSSIELFCNMEKSELDYYQDLQNDEYDINDKIAISAANLELLQAKLKELKIDLVVKNGQIKTIQQAIRDLQTKIQDSESLQAKANKGLLACEESQTKCEMKKIRCDQRRPESPSPIIRDL